MCGLPLAIALAAQAADRLQSLTCRGSTAAMVAIFS